MSNARILTERVQTNLAIRQIRKQMKFDMRPAKKFERKIPSKELRELSVQDTVETLPPSRKKKKLMKVITGEVLSSKTNKLPEVYDGRLKKNKKPIPDEELAEAPSEMALITEEILNLLDEEDSESAINLTQKHLLRTVVLMLPQAERMIHASKSARGVHNFNVLVGTCREIMADIQMSRDNKFLATGINVRVLQPGFIEIVNMIVNTVSIMKQEITPYVPADKKVLVNGAIDDATKTIAKFCEMSYKQMAGKVESHLD